MLISLNKKQQKAFLFIFFISLVGLSSLLQSNSLHLDDYWRLVDGNMGWDFNARPLATQVNVLFQLGKPFTDISPLTQILGIAVYSLGLVYIGKKFQINNLLLFILSGAIFVLNPYNLSIYSFVLDSLSMTLSIFSANLSLYLASLSISEVHQVKSDYFKINRNSPFICALSILLIVIALCLYQPGISFYFIGYILFVLNRLCLTKDYRKSLIEFIFFFVIFIISMAIYIPIKNNYELDEYTLKQSQLPEINNLFITIINNIIKSWHLIQVHLGNNIIFILIVSLFFICFVTIILTILIDRNGNQTSIKSKIISILLGTLYFFIVITSFIFPSYILANPPFHSRIFIGFIAAIGYVCFFLSSLLSQYKLKSFEYIFVFYLSLILLSFINVSLTYGNVLHQQDLYESRIGTLIINDIEAASNKYSISLTQPKVTFINSQKVKSLRRNNLTTKAIEKYPIIQWIAYPYFTADNFGITKFKTFGLNFESYPKEDIFEPNKDYYEPATPPVMSRQLYDVYLEKDDKFVILFK